MLGVWPICNAETAESPRIHGALFLGDLPTVVAQKEGFFDRYLSDPRVTYGLSGTANLASLRAGEADFALTALTPAMLDYLSDPHPGQAQDPVIIASLTHSNQLTEVVTLKTNGFTGPSDLREARVGLVKGTNAHFVWWVFAAYHGFDPQRARLVDLPVEDVPASLTTGEIDAAVLWEPWVSRLRERHGDTLTSFTGANIYLITNKAQPLLAT